MTPVLVPADAVAVTAKGRTGRVVRRAVIGVGVVAVVTLGMAGSASAQTVDGAVDGTVGANVDANVGASAAVSLAGLTADLTLTGALGVSVLGTGAVAFGV